MYGLASARVQPLCALMLLLPSRPIVSVLVLSLCSRQPLWRAITTVLAWPLWDTIFGAQRSRSCIRSRMQTQFVWWARILLVVQRMELLKLYWERCWAQPPSPATRYILQRTATIYMLAMQTAWRG